MIPVKNSSNYEAFGYVNGCLYMKFKGSGRLARYENVPAEVYTQMAALNEQGKSVKDLFNPIRSAPDKHPYVYVDGIETNEHPAAEERVPPLVTVHFTPLPDDVNEQTLSKNPIAPVLVFEEWREAVADDKESRGLALIVHENRYLEAYDALGLLVNQQRLPEDHNIQIMGYKGPDHGWMFRKLDWFARGPTQAIDGSTKLVTAEGDPLPLHDGMVVKGPDGRMYRMQVL